MKKAPLVRIRRNNNHLTQTCKTSGVRIIDTEYQFNRSFNFLKEMESMGEEQETIKKNPDLKMNQNTDFIIIKT